MRRTLLVPVFLVGALATYLIRGPAGDAGRATGPGASATAVAVSISTPDGKPVTSQAVAAPPPSAPAVGGAFAYPADGSIVKAQSTTASASSAVTKNASAKASSVVTALSIFGGELTADAVNADASGGTGYLDAGGNMQGSGVTNLRYLGQPVTGTTVALADWGRLTVGAQTIDTGAPAGVRAYHETVVELDLQLTAAHGGLPAGSEIRIGDAGVDVQTAPPATRTAATGTSPAGTTPTQTALPELPGDSPSLWPKGTPSKPSPLRVHPKLTAGRYVFPVYGPVSYGDTYGAPRSDTVYHHGDDIFGQLGQPLLACTDGTVFSVGWNKIGGNRLWILDDQGNQFYYAHLSAFAANIRNGVHVKAGEVVGFMGDTGDAEGTPDHLHFEVHPVAFLYLGYDGAVDPTPYLNAWQHQKDLPFPVAAGWAPNVPGAPRAPEPGAILLGQSDISTSEGLSAGSVARALRPLARSQLLQTIVPVGTGSTGGATTVAAPKGDLGRG